jgi:methylmalonyl-CoA/ethylmalonyl-CoA epimerase
MEQLFDRVHHTAFLVGDVDEELEDVLDGFEDMFGLDLFDRVTSERDAVDVALYNSGNQIIELMSPLEEQGWPYEHLRENGTGFFHIAFEVDDIRDAMKELERRGIRMKVDEPNQGNAWLVATMNEEDTFVPMQVVEDSREVRPDRDG